MQAAPPVSVRGTGGGSWLAVQAALLAAAAAALTAWSAGWVLAWAGFDLRGQAGGVGLVSFLVALGVGAWQWCAHRSRATAELAWDGQRWWLDGCAGRIDVMIDLDRWMLLRFHPEARSPRRWTAARAAEVGPAWHGLRVAAQGRAPLAASPE